MLNYVYISCGSWKRFFGIWNFCVALISTLILIPNHLCYSQHKVSHWYTIFGWGNTVTGCTYVAGYLQSLFVGPFFQSHLCESLISYINNYTQPFLIFQYGVILPACCLFIPEEVKFYLHVPVFICRHASNIASSFFIYLYKCFLERHFLLPFFPQRVSSKCVSEFKSK